MLCARMDTRLYDICQNVHEWCSDWYQGNYYAELCLSVIRVVRNAAGEKLLMKSLGAIT